MIGVDEAINTVQEAVRYAYERAADVFVLKLVKTGGSRMLLRFQKLRHPQEFAV